MLTEPQKKSEPIKDLKYYLGLEKGLIIYTASTMKEQRDIAEYINTIDGENYEIWDFSQKETHPMKKELNSNSSKLIITNMQEIGLAPYCKSDDRATVTLDDKIDWYYRKIENVLRRHEGTMIQMINLLRDYLFRDRKIICGMHPKFLEKLQYQPYYNYIDDWLDYSSGSIEFNKNPEFTQSLPLSTNSNNSNQIQAHDMIFVFENQVIRCPNFTSFMQYPQEKCIEQLSQLPKICFPSNIQNDMERS